MRRSVTALTSACAGLGIAVAATVWAPASSAKPPSAKPSAKPALVMRETMRQTLSPRGPGADAVMTVRERRRMHAVVTVSVPEFEKAAVTVDSDLGLRIGDCLFERPISQDRRWRPGAKRADFRAANRDSMRRDVTVVRARWNRGTLKLSVRSTSDVRIATSDAGAATQSPSSPIDGAACFGNQNVHLRGATIGTVERKVVPVLDSTVELAQVDLVGRADVVGVMADSQPPVLTIESPAADSTVAAETLTVKGAVSDDRSIASVAWSLDGGAERSTPFVVDPSSGGLEDVRAAFAFDVPATVGRHSLRVLAADDAGDVGSTVIDFTVPPPPSDPPPPPPIGVPPTPAPAPAPTPAPPSALRACRWGAWCVDSQARVQQWGYMMTSPNVAPGIAGARFADGNLCAYLNGTVTTLHGDPTGASSSSAPFAIAGLADIVDVSQCSASAPNASYALKSDGTVWAWGDNSHGQLGDGTTTSRYQALQVSGLPTITSISAGADQAVVLDSNGDVWTWGGMVAQWDVTQRVPHKVAGVSNAVMAVASQFDRYATGAAILADGTLWMWGDATSGQLGAAASGRTMSAFQVSGVSEAKTVALGYNHVLLVLADGTVLSRGGPTSQVWGYWGELGDGTMTPHLDFASVSGLYGVVQVAAGAHSSYAMLGDGALRGWGINSYGGVGDGTNTDRSSPAVVTLAQ